MAHQFECTQNGCDFMVRANDESEVVSMVREHAQNKHGLALNRSDVESGMQQV